ncbi:MAG: hypothetical protein KIG76_00660 [Eubacteriales bacterium]|nr:hypothetical protein [Candidatus Colimorpha enterica]
MKRNVTFAGTNALTRYTSSVGYAATFPSEGKAKAKSCRAARQTRGISGDDKV